MGKFCCFPFFQREGNEDTEDVELDDVPRQRPVAAPVNMQLPQPAKLAGGNYDFEHWIASNNTTGSLASSRSHTRTPESFLPDPIGVEFDSDSDDDIHAPKTNSGAAGAVRTLARRLSQDDKKRAAASQVKLPPDVIKEQAALKRAEKAAAAYRAEVRRNSMARIQAQAESENSSARSISTRGSNRVYELETVVEDPEDHKDNIRSGPRDEVKFSVMPGSPLRDVDYPSPPTRPRNAKLPDETLKSDPADYDIKERRRDSCPRPDTGSKVSAVLQERPSMPIMPPPPTLVAKQAPDDQDDTSLRTWELSQANTQRDSQSILIVQSEDAATGLTQDTTQSNNVSESQHQSDERDKEVPQSNDQPKATSEVATASDRSRASESSQSQDGSAWKVWLLAQKLGSQENSVAAANEAAAQTEVVSSGNDEANSKVLGSATLTGSGTSGQLTIRAPLNSPDSNSPDSPIDLQSALVMNLEMENEMDRMIQQAEEEGALCQERAAAYFSQQAINHGQLDNSQPSPQVSEQDQMQDSNTTVKDQDGPQVASKTVSSSAMPTYPSSSVYSSTQNTRPPSFSTSKDASSDENSRYILESLKGIEFSPFAGMLSYAVSAFQAANQQAVSGNLRFERSDDSYRTAMSKRSTSDAALPSVALPSEEIARDENNAKLETQIETQTETHSEAPASSQLHSRKSSFLQILRHRSPSGSKGHRKSKSQPSANLAPLNTSSESLEVQKRSGHLKKLSNLSIRSNMQPISTTEAFVAPKLNESTTIIWKRAFEVEHHQREKSATPSSIRVSKSATPGQASAGVDVTSALKPNDTAVDASLSPKPTATPPASWAKWASHTRAERTAAAGSADDVKQKDFATVTASKDKQIWVTDKDSAELDAEVNQGTQSISKKLGKAMKTGLNKMVASKSKNKQSAQLEYPELEILPTKDGYKDLKALEESIAAMKSSQRAKMATNPALAIAEVENESQQSISRTLPTQILEAEHARHESADDADSSSGRHNMVANPISDGMTVRPVTPANLVAPQTDGSATATTENWVTPVSRMSDSPASGAKGGYDSEAEDNVSIGNSKSITKASA
ncbi:hypothetical protein CkaCkLH20_08071 [Colletotrichum karsti]|uniref:Uncharacterized protein n=1 Tax=Colletotrichum karsti TaxID=1095194 RepID=A0A9P6HZK6_9PEZI|nr:uncharacterized protein CkaCkLH20_08071 [Colletotrichum karsti]KAF9874508.1 hypothetical protein CkaCkLH20_08071 [Colletotrichum karsti]